MCPRCKSVLAIPPGCGDCFARCGQCRFKFRLPQQTAVTDEAIAGWLSEPAEIDESVKAGVERAEPSAVSEESSGQTVVLPAITGEIRLVKVDRRGALFEFPASRLLEKPFRCTMPRRCLRCGTRVHLHAHVIIFAHQLTDSVSLEAEHSAGSLRLSEKEVRDLSCEDVIARLPRVPNVPAPGDLPMPYWLCDMCSSAGVISGQIQVSSTTGKGKCRLLIRNLRGAEEFLMAAGGRDTDSCAELKKWIDATEENPWDTVPLVIQHRLEQWFKPDRGEHFVTYVPDRDYMRTEDGMAGLVISDRRLIYHRQTRHREAGVTEPLELQLATGGGKGSLRIKTAEWEVKHIALDRDGIDRLRRGLVQAKFQAVWH